MRSTLKILPVGPHYWEVETDLKAHYEERYFTLFWVQIPFSHYVTGRLYTFVNKQQILPLKILFALCRKAFISDPNSGGFVDSFV